MYAVGNGSFHKTYVDLTNYKYLKRDSNPQSHDDEAKLRSPALEGTDEIRAERVPAAGVADAVVLVVAAPDGRVADVAGRAGALRLVISHAALGVASTGVWQGAWVDAEAVLAGPVRGAVVVVGTLGSHAPVDRLTLVASRAQAHGVVVGGLAESVLAAVRGLARVSTAAGYASLAGDAILVPEAAGRADTTDAVEAVVAVPGAQTLLEAGAVGTNFSAIAIKRHLAGSVEKK